MNATVITRTLTTSVVAGLILLGAAGQTVQTAVHPTAAATGTSTSADTNLEHQTEMKMEHRCELTGDEGAMAV